MLRAVATSVGPIGPAPGLLVPVVLLATAQENRLNTAVQTNSTQLTYNVPIAGQYQFDVVVNFMQSAAGAAGVICNVNYSGTIVASAVGYWYAPLNVSPGSIVAATVGATQVAISTLPTNPVFEPLLIRGWMNVSTTGTFALAFAQQTASATITTQLAGTASQPSSLIIKRIA